EIVSLEAWTRQDRRTAGWPMTFEERQQAIADIRLIPAVPEDVQITFRRAKDSYICGHFRYDFFTVSTHYAALAVEAAIKARWSAGLPQTVTVSCDGASTEVAFPTYTRLLSVCRSRGWRSRPLANGQRLPTFPDGLLDWLVRQRIVTGWDRKQLKGMLSMRNALSHVEHASTETPATGVLRLAAELINTMFATLGSNCV
ncbi:MAG TPA: hypothetical protein VGI12_16730, partial [Vicinamibacterales bacterium]